jgi:peptidyl-prolyl cis-trans isomerase C
MALALTAAVAVAQDKPAPPAPAPQTNSADPVIVSAGDVTIHQSEFENALKTLPAEYQSYASGAGKKQFAEDFLRMKLLAAQGYKGGLQNDPDVVQQLTLMRDNLVANAQLKKIESSVTVSEDDVKKGYDANKKDYEQVHARHILIAFKGSPAAQGGKKELTDAEAKAKAESIRKQLVAGADFAELAKKESDDTGSGGRGGDLGTFGHGQMVPEFEQAAFEAKAGEISPIVRTQYGYHIIKVESHDMTPFAEARATLEKNLRQKQVQASLDKLKEGAKFDEAYFTPPKPPTPTPTAEPAKPAAKSDAKKPATKK